MRIRSVPWLYRFLREVIPQVDQQLYIMNSQASRISDEILKQQALASLNAKSFHCYGGGVMALIAPPKDRCRLITVIVALQTISDYLDNLCDRMGLMDEKAFALLHESMTAAITPDAEVGNYYANYGGLTEDEYLPFLVQYCQEAVAGLPSLRVVYARVLELIGYYSALQSLKHIDHADRESRLRAYIENQVPNASQLQWWELAAATGSTLGMFALLSLAARPNLQPPLSESTFDAYFPWVCGLHIFLDYFIDQAEDKKEADLNFVAYYTDEEDKWRALRLFTDNAHSKIAELEPAHLHRLIVSGLLAMYLSDSKVNDLGYSRQSRSILRSYGAGMPMLYEICRVVRKKKNI
ncbi:MAG: tetraprenyl-beta-curcumene synthase family protein [Acidobacteriota bacterium]